MLPHATGELDRFHAENAFLQAFRPPRLWREVNGYNLFARLLNLLGTHLPSKPPCVFRAFEVPTTTMGQGDLHRRFDGIIGGAEHDRTRAWLPWARSGAIVSADRELTQDPFRWPDFDAFLRELAANWSDKERRVTRLGFLDHKM